MKKTIIVTLKLEVTDLDKERREECAEMEGCKTSDLPRINEYSAHDLAEPLEGALSNQEELFAGTGIYAEYEDIRILSAKFEE